MDARKKIKDKSHRSTENKSNKQPAFIEGWKGSRPTEPFPVGRPLTQAEKDKEKNIKWHYNRTRGQYWYLSEIPRNKKLYEKAIHTDTSKSVIDLVDFDDSSDEEEFKLDEQTKKIENSQYVSSTQSSIFSSSTKVPSTDKLTKNCNENSSNSKRKRS
jgi:hypothetical protein